MPTLALSVSPLQNPERYAQLASALTDLTHRVLHKRPEVTSVLIDDVPQARWAVGGQPVRQPIAWLRIDITAGTNTEAEKADFIHQAHALLADLVGGGTGLAEASYVTVHELPASDWGYGGHTQAARQRARAENRAGS